MVVAINEVLDWTLGLLTTYTHNSELQVIAVPLLVLVLCKGCMAGVM
jgi:hypothetical protein